MCFTEKVALKSTGEAKFTSQGRSGKAMAQKADRAPASRPELGWVPAGRPELLTLSS